MNPSNQPEPCICGYDPAIGYRMDIVCPVRDHQPKQNTHTSNADDPISNSRRSTVVDAHGSSISDTQAEVGLRDYLILTYKYANKLTPSKLNPLDPVVENSINRDVELIAALFHADKAAAVVEATKPYIELIESCISALDVAEYHDTARGVESNLARLQSPTVLTEQEQLEVSFCQMCISMTHTHDGICTRCGELKGTTAGEGESV
jgi:hypothetical protein